MNNCKLVVVDGPRGAGKSTTAEELARQLSRAGVPSLVVKKGPRDPLDEYANMNRHLDWWLQAPHLVVVDRFVATEWVMSTAHFRVPAKKLLRDCLQIDGRLIEINAIHLILLPSLETLEARLEARGPNGRSWDMPKQQVHGLWEEAHALLASSELWRNENYQDQQRLIDSVVTRLTGIRG